MAGHAMKYGCTPTSDNVSYVRLLTPENPVFPCFPVFIVVGTLRVP